MGWKHTCRPPFPAGGGQRGRLPSRVPTAVTCDGGVPAWRHKSTIDIEGTSGRSLVRVEQPGPGPPRLGACLLRRVAGRRQSGCGTILRESMSAVAKLGASVAALAVLFLAGWGLGVALNGLGDDAQPTAIRGSGPSKSPAPGTSAAQPPPVLTTPGPGTSSQPTTAATSGGRQGVLPAT